MKLSFAFYFLCGHIAAEAFTEWREDGGVFKVSLLGIAAFLAVIETGLS